MASRLIEGQHRQVMELCTVSWKCCIYSSAGRAAQGTQSQAHRRETGWWWVIVSLHNFRVVHNAVNVNRIFVKTVPGPACRKT